MLGAHVREVGQATGTSFAVWAPNARGVRVTGDFNYWDGRGVPDALARRHRRVGAVRARRGRRRQVQVRDLRPGRGVAGEGRPDGQRRPSGRPPPRRWCTPRGTPGATPDWVAARAERQPVREPMSIYEVHLGSWRPGLSYRRAGRRAGRVRHRPRLHARGVPARRRAPVRRLLGLPGHLVLRAHVAVRQPGRLPLPGRRAAPGRHRRAPRLGARALPAGRVGAGPVRRHPAVRARRPAARRAARTGARSSSTSAAPRCATSWSPTPSTGWRSSTSTGCASTRSRPCSTWTTRARTASGTRTSTAAGRTWTPISFLQEVNATCYKRVPGITMIAEESTAWPGVTRPVYLGGLGFGFKWNMGWMHDTLNYLSQDPDLPPVPPQRDHVLA